MFTLYQSCAGYQQCSSQFKMLKYEWLRSNLLKICFLYPAIISDKVTSCVYWKSLGYCESKSVYFPYMQDNCEKSCNTCKELSVANALVHPRVELNKLGTVLTVTCHSNKRFVLMGEQVVTCAAEGEWSTKPKCQTCGKQFISGVKSVF